MEKYLEIKEEEKSGEKNITKPIHSSGDKQIEEQANQASEISIDLDISLEDKTKKISNTGKIGSSPNLIKMVEGIENQDEDIEFQIDDVEVPEKEELIWAD